MNDAALTFGFSKETSLDFKKEILNEHLVELLLKHEKDGCYIEEIVLKPSKFERACHVYVKTKGERQ